MSGAGVGEGVRQRVAFLEAKPFSGGSLSTPFQNRCGAIAFISYAGSNSVKDGSRLAGCSRKQCILPPFSSKQKAIYVVVLLYFPKVAFYFPKLAVTYMAASFVMLSRQQDAQ